MLYRARRIRGRKIGDNTQRKGRGCTNQEATNGGGSATVHRGKAEAVQINRPQKGEDWRQYREEPQRLYRTRVIRVGRIGDKTERKAEAIRIKRLKGGRIGDKTERKGRGCTDQ